MAETTVPRPPIGQYAQLSDILQRYLSAAITEPDAPPKVAMEAAAGETRRVLGRFDREGGEDGGYWVSGIGYRVSGIGYRVSGIGLLTVRKIFYLKPGT